MQRLRVRSSNLDVVEYRPNKEQMVVTFKSGGKYIVFDVDKELWQSFIYAPSKGKWYWNRVRRTGKRVSRIRKG